MATMTRRFLGLAPLVLGGGALAAPGKGAAPAKPAVSVRAQYQASDADTSDVSGVRSARFNADEADAYLHALGSHPCLSREPWLALSGGGENGAFGAGILAGWSERGDRPSFSVITGISTGALIAPFAFAGERWDAALRAAYTAVTAADIFEFGATPESLLDTWPLARLIERQVTPELLADVAAQHRAGRRLFVLTTNVDTGRPVAWNMGAIADTGSPAARKLFGQVLLASSSIPGIFPPVHLDVDTPHGRVSEMHVDGSVTTPFYVAPETMVAGTRPDFPGRDIYVVVNSRTTPEFDVTAKMTLAVLGRAFSAAVKAMTRLVVASHAGFAQRSGLTLRLASIGPSFADTSPAPFDGRYMASLFRHGAEIGRAGTAFVPPTPGFRVAAAG